VTVRVPYPIRVDRPPCLASRPPVPAPGSQPGDEVWDDYYRELVAWAWGAWTACRPVAN
jgi:hypothetical protein